MDGQGQAAEVTQAIESGDAHELDHAVDRLLDRLRRGADPETAVAAAAALQSARRFDALLKLADTAARTVAPDRAPELWLYAVTGLIELDATASAERLVGSLLADAESPWYRGVLSARLGRIKKDRFVDSGDPAVLAEAIDAYAAAHAAGNDPLWSGVNAVALRAVAARRGLAPDGGPPIDPADLLVLALSEPLPRSAWSVATEIELRIARGEPTGTLTSLATQLFDAPGASGFVFASLARQLREIWELDAADPLMLMLAERTLADGRGEVVLPGTPDGYERTFGTEVPIPLVVYRKGVDCACSVGTLRDRTGQPQGTVFGMRGGDLHDALDGRTVLVTNEHVVPDPDRAEAKPLPEELDAHFTGVAVDGEPLTFGGLRAIWRSPREALDITLLLTDDPAAEKVRGLEVAASPPRARPGEYVYVVGHPGGGALALSIRGNDLVDEDGVRLHYTAPTTAGSSGSPVFDSAWKLVGVHHKGSNRLPLLNGAVGTREANEGITIRAVREELAHRPPEL